MTCFWTNTHVTVQPAPGIRVRRGPDWRWGNQDGGKGKEGVVSTESASSKGWVRVTWDTGDTNNYRFGADDAYDLDLTRNMPGSETPAVKVWCCMHAMNGEF